MLQHTFSCDGRRNSTFWISCLIEPRQKVVPWNSLLPPAATTIDNWFSRQNPKVLLFEQRIRPNKSRK